MERLPIDDAIGEILKAVSRHGSAIVQAAPGSGKTTRVPPALLHFDGEILVLEPRRIAARMAARRVAFELGEDPGGLVGYQVRFESASGARTRLRYVTEGILVRRMMSDRTLRGVSCVVLDEFHERRIDTDLALALLLRLRETERPDLKLLIMSATLDPAPVAALLGGAPAIASAGRVHELTIEYTPYSAAPLEEQVAAAVDRSMAAGDVLVFLPGAAEIRRAARACARLPIDTYMLHGDMPADEQNRAVEPAPRRKLILATNVAESSITIPGVTVVIDSGLARVAGDSPWTGLPALTVQRVSKASAQQRAGRAARTAPGLAIRLYTAEDFARRRDHDTPEILRRELAQLCLDLHAMGVRDAAALRWLDPPPGPAIDAAEDLLRRLGAFDCNRELTKSGRAMAALPVHPRIGRLIVEAARRGAVSEGCRAAALLSSGARPANIDLLHALEASPDRAAEQAFRQLRSLAPAAGPRSGDPEEVLAQAVLLAFPDRVARRREGVQLLFAGGGSGVLAAEANAQFMVALDAEERSEHALPLVRLICSIRPEWLLDFFPERISESTRLEWNRNGERVETVSSLLYENLVIEESRSGAVDPAAGAGMLAAKAIEAGLERFTGDDELRALHARIDFAAEHGAAKRLGDADIAGVVGKAA
ncbi:MAG TPA: helicase-related protein, partial [Bryobacteraceae bacterium]|nr:helicase-related protein [Bryobacteraceae bacterium]